MLFQPVLVVVDDKSPGIMITAGLPILVDFEDIGKRNRIVGLIGDEVGKARAQAACLAGSGYLGQLIPAGVGLYGGAGAVGL